MTALDGMERLESPGTWRAEADEPPRAVHVALGKASLVMQDGAGAALTHWSLPALERRNPGGMPARYGPAPGATEELEIAEPDMVAALDRVIAAVARGRRRPGALRRVGFAALAGLVGLVAMVWLPEALRDHARNVMPPAQREEIGQRILAELGGPGAAPCSGRAGTEALATLKARILPTQPGTLTVLRGLEPDALALPGGLIVLSERLLTAQDDPNVAAGHALAVALGARIRPPVAGVLDGLGPWSVMRLLASGAIPDAALAAHARSIAADPPPLPDAGRLRAGFDSARLAWMPWADATGRPSGDAAPSGMQPALDDTAWQALREICSG